jgi:hypothetical protein
MEAQNKVLKQSFLINSNFRNNQNYLLWVKDKKRLLSKVEFKTRHRINDNLFIKEKSVIVTEYTYLQHLNWRRFYRSLNIGEFWIITNTLVIELWIKFFKLLKPLFLLLLEFIKIIFVFLLKNKYWRYILLIIFFILLYLIYDDIEVYTWAIMRNKWVDFDSALIFYFKWILKNMEYGIKSFFEGLLWWTIFLIIIYWYIKLKWLYHKWRLEWKYIFMSENIEKKDILVYRYN